MLDEIQKTFVRSFVSYLKKQVGGESMAPDAQESLEVAIQCLQAAFDIGEEEDVSSAGDSMAVGDSKDIDLFELFQSMYVERNPESLQMAESIKNEGNRLMKDGKYNEALLQYNRAITFDPKNPIYYCNRAAAYIRLGENDRAVTDCKSALVYNPSYSKAYGRLGIAYSNLGKYDEAQQAYSKAIELEPDNQDYRNNLEVARNARTQIPMNTIPHLTEGLNAMLSNPAIRNIFSNAEIDLDQIQTMSQNPVIMSTIGQVFSGMQGGSGSGASGEMPAMPNDMLQLFQTFASQLASAGSNENQSGRTGNNNQGDQQPPPST